MSPPISNYFKRQKNCTVASLTLTSLIVLGVLLSSGCFSTSSTTNTNINTNINEASNVEPELPSGGDIIEIDFYESVDAGISKLLKEDLPKLGLSSLSGNGRPESFE